MMIFHWEKTLLPGGFIGVDIFFVISGYLMTRILLSQKNTLNLAQQLKSFYLARIKRVVPVYFFVLSLVAVLFSVVLTAQDFAFFKDSLESAITFSSNQYFSTFGDYFAPSSEEQPLLHTWSLGVEMQFYLIYPFLILLLPNQCLGKILALLAITIVVWSSYQMPTGNPESIYYSAFVRMPEFLLGGLAFFYTPRIAKFSKAVAWFGLLCVLAGLVFVNKGYSYPSAYATIAVFGTALLIASNYQYKIFTNKVVIFIGNISYSLYLWHWPVLAFVRYITGQYELSAEFSLVYWMLSFGLAVLSYCSVEKFFSEKSDYRAAVKNAIGWSGVLGLLFVIFAFSSDINERFYKKIPVELTRYADSNSICHSKIVGDCKAGSHNQMGDGFLVIGDSHAAMLNIFFDKIGKENNKNFTIITGSSCVPIVGFVYKGLSGNVRRNCQIQINEVSRRLVNYNKVIVAAMWNGHLSRNEFKLAFENFLKNNADKKIYLLADVPHLLNNIPARMHHLQSLGLQFATMDLEQSSITANGQLQRIANQYDYVEYIDLVTDNLTFYTAPFYNGQMVYHDRHHLNELGSKIYADVSGEKLVKLLN